MNKRSIFKKAASVLLCAVLMSSAAMMPHPQAQTVEGLRDEYNKLQQQIEKNEQKLESIKNQMSSNEDKLSTLSAQSEAIGSQLDVLSSEISLLQADISVYDKQIETLDKKIGDMQAQITSVNNEIDQTQEHISERLRATYMAGTSSWIEILLNSDSMSSLLMRIQLLSSVTENDNKLIKTLEKKTKELKKLEEELAADRSELDSKRAVLLDKKSELDKKASTLTSKQNAFNSNYREISNLMSTLSKNSIAYQNEIAKQKRQREAFERQIDQMVSGGSQSGQGNRDDYYNDGKMMWPVPYKNSYISAGYGYYDPEDDGTYTMHPAIDIVVRENGVNVSRGKKIVAAQGGKILTRGYSQVGGNYVTIDHGDGYRTYYGHMTNSIVTPGEYVQKGQVIGYMGDTGYVTGPHLHFQVMQVRNGEVVKLNPLNFVTPPN